MFLDFYITNLASGAYGGSFTVEVVLSQDQIFYNGNDSKVITKTFSNGIGPNGSSTGTRFSGNISIFLAAPNNNFGTHYILIKADYSNNIDETNENNNVLAVQIRINDPLGGRFTNPITNIKKGQNKDQEIEESLENIIADQDIAVYPNPFVEKLTLNIHDDLPSEVSIVDISGKLIWKKAYSSNVLEAIDLSSQPAGIYILKVANQEGIEVKRIVKR